MRVDKRSPIWVLPYTSDLSGSNVALWRLLKAIDRPEQFKLFLDPDSWLAQEVSKEGWDFRPLKTPVFKKKGGWLTLPRLLWTLRDYLSQLSYYARLDPPGLLFINCLPNLHWMFCSVFWWAQKRPPVLWWIHEYDLRPVWIAHFFRSLAGRLADRLAVVSPIVLENWQAPQGKRGHVLMPNIVPEFHRTLPDKPSVPLSLSSFLWVGTATPRKGLENLIGVMEGLIKQRGPCQLQIVAAVAPQYQYWFNQVLLHLQKISHLELEWVSQVYPLDPYYQADKILLQCPLLPESFNLTAFEAMSAGLCVFSTDTGGLAALAPQDSYVAWDGTVEQLVLQLRAWESAPEYRSQMCERAIKAARMFDGQSAALKFWKEVALLRRPVS